MGNNGVSKIIGIGDDVLEMNVLYSMRLEDVSHMDDFICNLIFTRWLDDEGFLNAIKNGSLNLSKGFLIVARGKNYCSLQDSRKVMC